MAYQFDMHNNQTAEGDFKFNLKGIIVGNGVTNWKWDGDEAYIMGGFPRGLSSIDTQNEIDKRDCEFYYEDNEPAAKADCRPIADKFYENTADINVYDIYRTCWTVNDTSVEDDMLYGFAEIDGEERKYRRKFSTRDYTPWIYEKENKHPMIKGGSCTWDSPVTDFFNQANVRKALHIPTTVGVWQECSDEVIYDSLHKASEWIYPIIRHRMRILHYSGDTDGAVPTYGTQQWMHELGWEIIKPWRSYYVDKQVAGSYTMRDGMDFGTIHGCGHMAPQWKRPQTWHLIFSWISKQEP